jgi:hypothetical protein
MHEETMVLTAGNNTKNPSPSLSEQFLTNQAFVNIIVSGTMSITRLSVSTLAKAALAFADVTCFMAWMVNTPATPDETRAISAENS